MIERTSGQYEDQPGCLTPWPEMGEAMRVWSLAGKPTVKKHHIYFLLEPTADTTLPVLDETSDK
ncbi:MAG: hypothetical protein EBR82_80360 [Caulobacteraceae bacterium]|nr:hypothetical protein [Caulobacteraceae bacterium]